MCCGQETTTVPMRRNEGACCHAQKLPSLDLRRTMPGKDSNEERIFKGLDCATPDPHLRSDYTLTGMRARCCTSDWKWGDKKHAQFLCNFRSAYADRPKLSHRSRGAVSTCSESSISRTRSFGIRPAFFPQKSRPKSSRKLGAAKSMIYTPFQ